MRPCTHSYITFKAIEYLKVFKPDSCLLKILIPNQKDIFKYSGILPDMLGDCRRGHVFKMDHKPELLGLPYIKDKYKVGHDLLAGYFKDKKYTLALIKDSNVLNLPYKSNDKNGGKLPDRVEAIASNLIYGFRNGYYNDVKSIARFLFILSHYIADAHMPLHCDLRDKEIDGRRRLNRDIHLFIENFWESHIPNIDDLAGHNLTSNNIWLEKPYFNLNKLKPLGLNDTENIRREMIYISRISYAVSREYIKNDYRNIDELFDDIGRENFSILTDYLFTDAIQEVASIWNNTAQHFLAPTKTPFQIH